ncbi:flagellar filament capping protein FliD [Comamonas kerstersii]|uniref:flagellar filament capping protein FliD n=1 Tax=Comamonas kerstersii TaxID=225992 RepID=UPI0026DBBE9F|nr:flagellar filament capping protein FliD [Comamonas kerstersii]
MAISSVGIGSGLDVESIVTQMIALEKQPIKTLEAKAEVIQSKISTYGEIKSLTDDLNAAVRDLTLDRTWNTVKINSSNSSAVNATMTGSAAAGSYNIKVEQLAQSQTSVSGKFDAATQLGAGVMRFEVGNPAKPNGVTSYDIDISASDNLEKVVAKINGHKDLSKTVIASIITDAAGKQQLMVRSRDTGTDSQFAVSFGAGVVTKEEYDADNSVGAVGSLKPLAAGGLKDLDTGFSTTQQAKNAEIFLNGVALESTSNTFAETIPGLSISVSAKGESLLTLTQDKDAVQASIQKFVDAYNALNDLLGSSTKYDQDSKVAGVLQGDSSTVSLQNALRMLTQNVVGNASGALNRLSDAGIQMLQGGKLSVNSTKLATALGDVDALKSMFAAKAEGLEQGGIAVRFKSFTDQLLAYEGTLNSKTDSLEDQLKRNSSEIDKVEKRAETVEERLRKQYTALDVKMASLGSLSSYVEQMVASWNKSKD